VVLKILNVEEPGGIGLNALGSQGTAGGAPLMRTVANVCKRSTEHLWHFCQRSGISGIYATSPGIGSRYSDFNQTIVSSGAHPAESDANWRHPSYGLAVPAHRNTLGPTPRRALLFQSNNI